MNTNPPELEPVQWVTIDRRRHVASIRVVTATWFGARELGAEAFRCDMGHVWAMVLCPGDEPAEVVRAEMDRRKKAELAAQTACSVAGAVS
jgi:hypothetical protein